jgi:transcriptional regulator with XRE-family HTH domain
VHNIEHNRLGTLIKTARTNKGLTQEQLAEKIGIGARHLMGIENEGKSPSFEVLYSLIRELNISADSIFYPESDACDTKLAYLTRLLMHREEQEIDAVTALAEVLLSTLEKIR